LFVFTAVQRKEIINCKNFIISFRWTAVNTNKQLKKSKSHISGDRRGNTTIVQNKADLT